MRAYDPSLALSAGLNILPMAEQQKPSGMPSGKGGSFSSQFSALSNSLAEQLKNFQEKKGLQNDPAMVAIRATIAELLRLHPESKSKLTGLTGMIETDIDAAVHNILHPVDFVYQGVPGTIWDVRHPFEKDSAFILVRGFMIVLILYFAIGAALKAHYEGATGSARIPHLAFWTDLPQLVSDGVNFATCKISQISGAKIPEMFGPGRDYKYASAKDSFANFEPLN